VTDWTVIWLGVIAVAVAIMALVQIGVIIVGLRLARQLSVTLDELRREMRPLVEKVHRIADDAARATSLATIQIERIDDILSTTTARVDEGLAIVRNAMGGPLRQGYAVAMALRAALSAFRRRPHTTSSGARPIGHDEDDALFVG
jgi:hypothetical protein